VGDLVSFEQGFGFVAFSALVTLEKVRILVKLHVSVTLRWSGKCFRARLALKATYGMRGFYMLSAPSFGRKCFAASATIEDVWIFVPFFMVSYFVEILKFNVANRTLEGGRRLLAHLMLDQISWAFKSLWTVGTLVHIGV
jgi:hypothetical protein